MEESNEVRVKNEPICYSQSIVKTEEEVVSIGFLNEDNEETSLENNEAASSNSKPSKPNLK